MSGPDLARGDDDAATSGDSGLLPLAATVCCVLAAVVWLVWYRDTGLTLGYLGGPVSMIAAAVTSYRLAVDRAASVPTRAFWRYGGHAATCIGAGSGVGVLIGRNEPGMSPWIALLMMGGILFSLVSIAKLPWGRRSAVRWAQFALDGATVAVGGSLVFYYLAVHLAPPDLDRSTVLGSGLVGVTSLLVVVVIGKASMNPDGPVDGTALRLLATAPTVAVVSTVLQVVGTDDSRLVMSALAVPLVAVAACAAVVRQRCALRHVGNRGATRGRDVFGILPFLAVCASITLLITVSARQMTIDERNVVVGAVLIGGFVVIRHLLDLRETDRLMHSIRRQQAQLEYQAHHDPLTGLVNRTRFGAILAGRLDARQSAGVLVIDIDDFKMVNDTMGHAVGDQLLFEVAERLRAFTVADELPARLGADEFAVLLEHDDVVATEQTATRILASLAVPFQVGEHHLLAHASIGIAIAGPDDDADEVLRNADIAMYEAKSAGKASWARFEPRMREEAVNHARLGSELHDAILRHELFLAYQPVFDIVNGTLTGVEALVRWQHPVRGPVPPGDFVPVAERTGLIVPLGSWVLREACEQLARWTARYGRDVLSVINVNVAARQLRDPHFVDEVAGVLSDTRLNPSQLVLEVTESSVLEGRQVRETLQALHELGVRLALDDFGTGSSSLSLLRAFPVDVLKLDKSFVDGICEGEDRGRLAVAAAVAQLAETLELSAVAEGIETQEQLVRLRALGYRFGQGFHLARPLPADEVALLIERAHRVVPA